MSNTSILRYLGVSPRYLRVNHSDFHEKLGGWHSSNRGIFLGFWRILYRSHWSPQRSRIPPDPIKNTSWVDFRLHLGAEVNLRLF